MVRWCWVNFQCRGILLIRVRVGQGPTALAVGAGAGLFGHFISRLSFLFSFSLGVPRIRFWREWRPAIPALLYIFLNSPISRDRHKL